VGLRCVIVDDNNHFLAAARDLLEREGIAVVGVASTGAEALRRVEELEPELALVDIDLGAESGFDVARRLAGAPGHAATRTIMISTHAQADFEDLIDASPATGFVAKADLSAKAIRAILERAPGAATD
jgi:CheY-like chemotaxis protein